MNHNYFRANPNDTNFASRTEDNLSLNLNKVTFINSKHASKTEGYSELKSIMVLINESMCIVKQPFTESPIESPPAVKNVARFKTIVRMSLLLNDNLL